MAPKRLRADVAPGASYIVPNDGVYVLSVISNNSAHLNAWWLKDGIEFFGVSNGEACMPIWFKKGTKLTTRSGDALFYSVRSVF